LNCASTPQLSRRWKSGRFTKRASRRSSTTRRVSPRVLKRTNSSPSRARLPLQVNARLRVIWAIRRLPTTRRPIEDWKTSTVTGAVTRRVKLSRKRRPAGAAETREKAAVEVHAAGGGAGAGVLPGQSMRGATSPLPACARHSSAPGPANR
jgi:hypothetical protein